MSVNIKFSDSGHDGIIAEGSYLWEASKRLGVRLPAECEGQGQCDTCAVIVEEGATLLSSLTDAERERLSPERLAAGERLACQTKVERTGDLVLRAVPITEREETTEETVKDFRKEFQQMPLMSKMKALTELEAITAYQTISAIASLPSKLSDAMLDVIAGRGRTLDERARRARRPAEQTDETAGGASGDVQ